MQDALTLAFDITAVAAVAYLSTEFCLGLADRVAHPKPAPAPALPDACSEDFSRHAVTTATPLVTPIPVPASPATPPSPPSDPVPGLVQPLPNLDRMSKAELEYVPLQPLRSELPPNRPLVDD